MNVPKIRFREFNDEWYSDKLSTYAKKITSKNKNLEVKNVISNSAVYGLISQRDFFDKDIANETNIDNYYIINNNDFVYNPRKSNEAPYGPINRYSSSEKGVISPLYLCFNINNKINSLYLEKYFKSNKWHRYIYLNGDAGARHDRVSIKDEVFFDLNMYLPSIIEQDKIGLFLTLLDKKIELQSKKIEALKLYKKGLVNKVFENNNIEKIVPLKSIGNSYTGLSGKTKDDFDVGNELFIPFISVLNNNVDLSNFRKVNVIDKTKQNKVYQKDLFFTVSSETAEEVGMCSTINKSFDNLYLNSFCFGFRLNNLCEVDNNYLCELLLSKKYRKIITNLGQGFTRVNISKNQILDIEVELPSIEDQNKISYFISIIKNKISLEENKLLELQELKKGLMKNMFV